MVKADTSEATVGYMAATARRIRQPPRAQLSGEAATEWTGKKLAAKMKPDGRKASAVVDSVGSRNTSRTRVNLHYQTTGGLLVSIQ